ncbi:MULTISPECIES: site-specific DNA-methyltransferase [unclassified Akkermansia]
MEKMRMESIDMTAQNIEKIGALFPNCITETVDENGKMKKAINFDLLRQMLSGDVVEGDEVYEFTWVGKKAAIVEANKPIRKTLRPCKEDSVNWDTTENLYIEGDNLEVLKLLQESYLGKVKMIYIDPPYNTGSDSFVYNDSFTMDEDEYETGIGIRDQDKNKLFHENNSSNPRFHSDWCSMMYERFLLARNLLSVDGVLVVSISDAEFHNLKSMLDELFGADNYLGDIVWNSTKSVTNTALISVSHTYNLVYFKRMQYFVENRSEFRLPDDGEGFENPDNDPRGSWKADPFQVGGWRPNQQYEIVNPNTGVVYKPNPDCSWKNDYEHYLELVKDNRIVFGKTGDGGPQRKRFKWEAEERGKVAKTWWDDVETTTNGTQLLKKMFDGKILFSNPKPVGLLVKLIQLAGSKDGIVMDFFSGSATTAHAVMQLNAEDGGHRKFIMVQLPEPCDKKSEAFQAGYKNICEIGKERIRRAGKKIKEETGADIDYGFRVFKLDDSNMKDVYYSPAEYDQGMLSGLESNIKEDRTDLDLLFGCLLEWGLPLSERMTVFQIDGVDVHAYGMDAEEYRGCKDGMFFYEDNYQMIDNHLYTPTHTRVPLLACFADRVPESIIRGIAGMKPLCAVFRDSCFQDSPAKINVTEVFKLLAPDTRVKVI